MARDILQTLATINDSQNLSNGHFILTQLIRMLPSLAWPLIVAISLIVARSVISELLLSLSLRIKSGAAIKTPWLEVQAVNVSSHTDLSDIKGVSSKPDNDDRDKDKFAQYDKVRGLFLVHRLFPSSKPGQLYDILVYVISHVGENAILTIDHVEYWYGYPWGGSIFTSSDRAKSFGLAISSFGPTLCSAKVVFRDGSDVMLYRYLDFEMGAYPSS